MSTHEATLERLFREAEQGAWDELLSAWRSDPKIGQACSHYRCPVTHRTFLHLAAQFGNEPACRELIRFGANAGAVTRESIHTAADIAGQRGSAALAELLKRAIEDEGSLWAPPTSPELFPSSHFWAEATERRAEHAFGVAYGGGVAHVPAGSRYFVDSYERTLVGWHGTVDPPCGMDSDPMIGDP